MADDPDLSDGRLAPTGEVGRIHDNVVVAQGVVFVEAHNREKPRQCPADRRKSTPIFSRTHTRRRPETSRPPTPTKAAGDDARSALQCAPCPPPPTAAASPPRPPVTCTWDTRALF